MYSTVIIIVSANSLPLSILLLSFSADSYLLQVQEYVPPQPKPAIDPTKTDASTNGATPTPPQPDPTPQWYDVDVVKGTQFTVTAYQVPQGPKPDKVCFQHLLVLKSVKRMFTPLVLHLVSTGSM